MPRPNRRVVESPESRALDAARRTYDKTEALLDRQLKELKMAAITAVLRGKLTVSEAGRRAGYTREYMSTLVTRYRAENPDEAARITAEAEAEASATA